MKLAFSAVLCVMSLVGVMAEVSTFGPVQEVNRIPEVHVKKFQYLPDVGPQCNFWIPRGLVSAPWNENCRVFRTDNCNRYEISVDGKSIDSCEQNKTCIITQKKDECVEFYPPRNMSARNAYGDYRFPDTDK